MDNNLDSTRSLMPRNDREVASGHVKLYSLWSSVRPSLLPSEVASGHGDMVEEGGQLAFKLYTSKRLVRGMLVW